MTDNKNNKALAGLQLASVNEIAKQFIENHEEFVSKLKNVIVENKNLSNDFTFFYPSVFALRLEAIEVIRNDDRFDISNMFSEVYLQAHDLAIHQPLEILVENVEFGLKCNREFKRSLVEKKLTPSDDELPPSDQLQFTYHECLNLVISQNDELTANKIIELLNYTLQIELVLFSLFIIHENINDFSEKVINELSYIVANAGQCLSALAMDMGIIETTTYAGQELLDQDFVYDEVYIKEQKELSELGIEDFESLFQD